MNQRPKNRIVVSLLFIALCCVCTAGNEVEGAVIAQFDFAGNDYTDDALNTNGANTGLNFGNSAAAFGGLTVSNILLSPGLNESAALGFAANDYDGALGFSTDVNDDRGFLMTDQTIYFQFSTAAGFAADLESLTFQSLKTRGNNATGSRVTHAIFFDPAGDPAADGLEGDTDFFVAFNHDHFGPGEAGAESEGADFTTGQFQVGPIDLSTQSGLTGTHTIAIRSYSSDGQDRDFGFDAITLNGSISAVPEPSSMVVIFALASVAVFRRRNVSK